MLKLDITEKTTVLSIDNDLHLQESDVLKKYLVYLQTTTKLVQDILNNRNRSLTPKQLEDARIEAERHYNKFVD